MPAEEALVQAGVDILGGTVGGLGNMSASRKKKRAYEKLASELGDLATESTNTGNTRLNELAYLYGAQPGQIPSEILAVPELAARYNKLAGTDMSQYDIGPQGDFQFDLEKATQEEMNPYLNDIVNAAVGDVEASAANAGDLFSGAAGKEIARSTYDLRAKEQGAARERALKRQGMKYQEWNDKFNNMLKAAEFNKGNAQSNIENAQGAYTTGANVRTGFSTQQGDIKTAADERTFGLKAEQLAARAKSRSTPTRFGAFAQGFAGATSEV